MSTPLDVYDSEMVQILDVLETLRMRAKERRHNYLSFQREIEERFGEIGFLVSVNWHSYAMNKVVQVGSALPEVTITGRVDPSFRFDPDQMVHEVTSNILDLPGQEGVIKTDQGGVFRETRRSGAMDH